MAWRRDRDDERSWPLAARLLEMLGQGMLLACAGLVGAALLGGPGAGLWFGASLGTAGLFCRAGANAIAAWDIEHRGVAAPRPPMTTDAFSAALADVARSGPAVAKEPGMSHVARLDRCHEHENGAGRGR